MHNVHCAQCTMFVVHNAQGFFGILQGIIFPKKMRSGKSRNLAEKINSNAKRALTKRRIPFLPAHVPAHVLAHVLAHLPAHVLAHVSCCARKHASCWNRRHVSCCNRRHVFCGNRSHVSCCNRRHVSCCNRRHVSCCNMRHEARGGGHFSVTFPTFSGVSQECPQDL